MAPLLRAHITPIEKGLGGLLLDLSRRLLTHVKLPGTTGLEALDTSLYGSTQHLVVHPNRRGRSQI
jgi:hypothetical protein